MLKATVVLLPLLGLSWVFGLLAVNRNTSVFAWLFTVVNSLQVKWPIYCKCCMYIYLIGAISSQFSCNQK